MTVVKDHCHDGRAISTSKNNFFIRDNFAYRSQATFLQFFYTPLTYQMPNFWDSVIKESTAVAISELIFNSFKLNRKSFQIRAHSSIRHTPNRSSLSVKKEGKYCSTASTNPLASATCATTPQQVQQWKTKGCPSLRYSKHFIQSEQVERFVTTNHHASAQTLLRQLIRTRPMAYWE